MRHMQIPLPAAVHAVAIPVEKVTLTLVTLKKDGREWSDLGVERHNARMVAIHVRAQSFKSSLHGERRRRGGDRPCGLASEREREPPAVSSTARSLDFIHLARGPGIIAARTWN